ncbi:hypothetical protein J3R30DRAFT_3508851 [Lentinula aciculospora]|uniref:B box-type domain-containing protein n=1 Tax=Lentinula aciculospora TaxID=153920 RepID=A0A9W9A793_9AGAR|nr:hypothetical protein J3R30DRAFT_3508851 [Lentinula aciculospora]
MATVKFSYNKRRKLSASPKLPSMTLSIPLPLPFVDPKNATLTCSSCHRRAPHASRSFIVFCARCGLPTCLICSRMCTASPDSLPSATHFTWIAVPLSTNPGCDSQSIQQPPSQSPQRFALTLNSANTNTVGHAHGSAKRKKSKDDDLLSEIRFGNRNEEEQSGLDVGCGRTVCKSCCIENNQNDTIACYDCHRFH